MQYFTKEITTQSLAEVYGKATLTTLTRYQSLLFQFKKIFRQDGCYFVSSPGRVELIGNHVDHNGGKVIGCAVNLDIVCAFAPNEKNKVVIKSKGRSDVSFNLDSIERICGGSVGMTKGVISYLKSQGYKIGGFYAILDSTIPIGGGMSSSAAFQLMVASIINCLYNDGKISFNALVYAGQYAENVYFGKPSGLFDQCVIATGGIVSVDFKSSLDCRAFDPRVLDGLTLIVVKTGRSHSDLTKNYAQIPQDMFQIAEHFQKSRLVDVNYSNFVSSIDSLVSLYGTRPVFRADHFFEECKRVNKAEKALITRDHDSLLQLLSDSGLSSAHKLQNCVADSDNTLMTAIEFVQLNCPDCSVRVHGGGFAGTILIAVKNENKNNVLSILENKFGKQNIFCPTPRKGTTVL